MKELICDVCDSAFTVSYRAWINRRYDKRKLGVKFYCCGDCRNLDKGKHTPRLVKCDQCNKDVIKKVSEITERNFCSRSCSVTYNNTHKTKGTRRSKLEVWLEKTLIELYPTLEFKFNQKDAIKSELDIYIPKLSLAFELNGVFHYEPIFGIDKMNSIQNNDQRKFQACLENSIELCIIDTSNLLNFKEHKAQKYLDIITNIIDTKFCRE